jgi:hypothetical protein
MDQRISERLENNCRVFILNFENMKKQDLLEILNGAATGYLLANTNFQWYCWLA